MRAYERNGVMIDQCGECRGIFLDRGELERLVDAESAFYQTVDSRGPAAARVPASGDSDVQGFGHYGDGHYGGGHYGSHGNRPYRKRKKGGFLSELFD
jgi:hypothetical protein